MRTPPRAKSCSSFNPTLVRFCPFVCTVASSRVVRFQSHLGSILPETGTKTLRIGLRFNPTLVRFCHQRKGPQRARDKSFNPTLVRFCRGSYKAFRDDVQVSIPPWFDFAPLKTCTSRATTGVSIPPWFDFALLILPKAAPRKNSFNPTLVRFCPFLGTK